MNSESKKICRKRKTLSNELRPYRKALISCMEHMMIDPELIFIRLEEYGLF